MRCLCVWQHRHGGILTGIQPFVNIPTNVDVILALYDEQLPFERPKGRLLDSPELDQLLWNLMLSCWLRNPDERPNMHIIHSQLAKIYGQSYGQSFLSGMKSRL